MATQNSGSSKTTTIAAREKDVVDAQDEGPGLPIVAIGASAGGLDALEQFFTDMPADSGMAFVLVQHLDPTHKSILVDLVNRYTPMKVFEVQDGTKVEPNCAYIIPPNRDMAILHGSLQPTVVARLWLKDVPLGIFSVFRSAVGTVAFFIAASYLFGPIHFVDLASPFLWQWMAVYGGIIIVSGQLAWDSGVRRSRSIDVSLATSFAPVAGVLGAFLILGEHPMQAHYIGGAVLIVGIAICLFGARQKDTVAIPEPDIMPTEAVPALDAEGRTGFKGV